MNRHIGTMAFLLALILSHGDIGSADTYLSQQDTKGDILTQEEALIVTTLNQAADAESNFYSTKDTASVLRFYAQDYAGIRDGKSETLSGKSKYLAEVLEQIVRGDPVWISSKVKNIKPSVEGRFGWATYEYEYQIGRSGGKSGGLQQVSQEHCTAIFRKQGDAWLIRHEHCSSTSSTPF